jgi:protein phosphatase
VTEASPGGPLPIPRDALVVLVGASGCGKSTFARARFRPTQVVSSDECRRLVADDEGNQGASREAFEVFRAIIRGRLSLGRLTVADATNLRSRARRELRELAAAYRRPVVAVVFDYPLEGCLRRASGRERAVPPEVIERQHALLQWVKERLPEEGYLAILTLPWTEPEAPPG